VARARVLLAGLLGLPAIVALAPAASSATPWAVCGDSDSSQKEVTSYDRYRMTAVTGQYIDGGSSRLRCGSNRWGYWHIVANHQSEWEQMARSTRQNWRDVADFAISNTLGDPDPGGTYRADNDTFCFQRVVFLYFGDQLMHEQNVVVIVAADSRNIITSYPGRC
jgi:hypothetical protein